MGRPAFTVIIPTFNRRLIIERALRSVLAQTYPADEIILIDDGSTDGTSAFIAAHFPAVRLLTLPVNGGQAAARNHGIRHARSAHLAFLDSDDIWHPDFLAEVSWAWEANPDAGIVYTQYEKVETWPGGQTTPIDVVIEGDQIEAMLRGTFIHSSSLMSTRRDWTSAVGGFDANYKISEDRAMYLRLLQYGPAIAVPGRLVQRCIGEDNLTHDFEAWWYDTMSIAAHFLADPAFATYRWLEDQSLVQSWTTIQWHDRHRLQAERWQGRS